jgi:hypothetical protein
LPEKEYLVLLKEPGFLAAMEAFLSPAGLKKKETALVALQLIDNLILGASYDDEDECVKELFESPCFAAVVRAAREKDAEISEIAYELMWSVTVNHKKTFFEYNGVPDALVRGLNTNHRGIVNQCFYILSDIVEDDGFPDNDILTAHSDLVTAVVNTFCEGGSICFACKLINYYFPLLILCSPISPLFHQGGATS